MLKVCLFVCLLALSALGVKVTLENGLQEMIKRIPVSDQAYLLQCSYTSTSSTPARIDWKYSKTADSNAGSILVFGGQVDESISSKYVFVPPASLRLVKVEKGDTGYYTCDVAVSGDSTSYSSGVYNVTVLVPPAKPVCAFPSDYALTLGFSAEFRCVSNEGVPTPDYKWYKNNAILPANPGLTNNAMYANTSYTYNTQTGTLTFSKVVAGDAGEYYCAAVNSQGQEHCTAVMITTKEQNVGLIVGIVFAVIFVVLLVAVLAWWTWRKGYCENVFAKSEPDEVDDDGSNDIMLDGHGPLVHKPPSEVNGSTTGKQEASMMI